MQKLVKQKYKTMKGEIKTNCYKITISKKIIEAAEFDENTYFEVKAEPNKITIYKIK